jgi:hypothetical protein
MEDSYIRMSEENSPPIDNAEAAPSDEHRDYFAELYVAGLMADAGWNVYFPHRDRGLDFIACKTGADRHQIIRPVQVKGKYPSKSKTDKKRYGYIGRLNQIHPDMVLAIPFFAGTAAGPAVFVAYLPLQRGQAPQARISVRASMLHWRTPVAEA